MASVENHHLLISTCCFPEAVAVAIDVIGRQAAISSNNYWRISPVTFGKWKVQY
jgi:hypothetical protein